CIFEYNVAPRYPLSTDTYNFNPTTLHNALYHFTISCICLSISLIGTQRISVPAGYCPESQSKSTVSPSSETHMNSCVRLIALRKWFLVAARVARYHVIEALAHGVSI